MTPGRPSARRVLATMSVAALVAAVCVLLGLWQWSRHADRSAEVALVQANLAAPAVVAEDVLDVQGTLPASAVWQRLTVTGTYRDEQVLLRNRPIGGGPGFHVLGFLDLTQGPYAGRTLVVDRGFATSGLEGSDTGAIPAPPEGEIEVVVRARADEPAPSRDAPAGQVQAVHVASALAAARVDSADPLPFYGIARAEDGAPPVGLTPLPSPTTDLGSNLSYAFQWWVFALGALVGGVVLLRRESAVHEGDDGEPGTTPGLPSHASASRSPGSLVSPAGRRPARARRRPTSEEEEDALLDAQSSGRVQD